jgi:hypothetical protein
MNITKMINQLTRRARPRTALFTTAGVLWVWLERVHTARFVLDVSRSGYVAGAWRLAESRGGQTLLLLAIFVAILACWMKLRALPAPRRRGSKRQPKRVSRGTTSAD